MAPTRPLPQMRRPTALVSWLCIGLLRWIRRGALAEAGSMSGLQSGSQDATGRLLQAISSFGCRYTYLHCTAPDYGPVAFRFITSKAGTLAQVAREESSGFSGSDGAVVSSRRSVRPSDPQGGDSRKPFIQSEVAAG